MSDAKRHRGPCQLPVLLKDADAFSFLLSSRCPLEDVVALATAARALRYACEPELLLRRRSVAAVDCRVRDYRARGRLVEALLRTQRPGDLALAAGRYDVDQLQLGRRSGSVRLVGAGAGRTVLCAVNIGYALVVEGNAELEGVTVCGSSDAVDLGPLENEENDDEGEDEGGSGSEGDEGEDNLGAELAALHEDQEQQQPRTLAELLATAAPEFSGTMEQWRAGRAARRRVGVYGLSVWVNLGGALALTDSAVHGQVDVAEGASLSASGTEFSRAAEDGVAAKGKATLENCRFEANRGNGLLTGSGAAVSAKGCVFAANRGHGDGSCGVRSNGGSVALEKCSAVGNAHYGVYVQAGKVTVNEMGKVGQNGPSFSEPPARARAAARGARGAAAGGAAAGQASGGAEERSQDFAKRRGRLIGLPDAVFVDQVGRG